MNNKNKAILKGIISFIPIIKNKFQKTTGGSSSARYCYSVFLRHFVNLYKHKKLKFFDIFSEVGPGDSLGVGIASLLLGFKKYEALDTFRFANIKKISKY